MLTAFDDEQERQCKQRHRDELGAERQCRCGHDECAERKQGGEPRLQATAIAEEEDAFRTRRRPGPLAGLQVHPTR